MRFFSSPKISPVNIGISALAIALVGGIGFGFAPPSRSQNVAPTIAPQIPTEIIAPTTASPEAVAPAAAGETTAEAVAAEEFGVEPEESLVQLASLKTSRSRSIRVGLSTQGGDISLLALGAMLISDSAQPGRRLSVPAGQVARFAFKSPKTVRAGALKFNGPIEIAIGGGRYGAWQMPVIKVAGGPTRASTNGENPRWSRPYRGDFEIAQQGASFEPAKHKGALRLVNVVPLEEYLKGVVPWEMKPTAPIEALKAQAICARGETLAKIQSGRHRADGFEMCDYDHCQGYPGIENESARSTIAVEQTVGLVLTHSGEIADAVYGTNSGGITAGKNDVWRGGPEPHLASRRDFDAKLHPAMARIVKPKMSEADWVQYCSRDLPSFARPGEDEIALLRERRRKSARTAALFQKDDLPEFYRWTREVSPQDLAAAASAKSGVPFASVDAIRVLDRAASGHIKKLEVAGRAADGSPLSVIYEKDGAIRSLLSGRLGSTTALPSSTFVVLPRRTNGAVSAWVFKGAGWGHGAGMCQRGAQNHARAGWNARRILQWYFTGVQIVPAP